MSGPSGPALRRPEFDMNTGDFERISRIAKAGWGLNLDKAKRPLIKSRLSKRLRQLQMSSFEAYCARIESGDDAEKEHFVTALTTNVTHFYRERHHFDFLEQQVLPGLLHRAKSGERLRFWSAGCSSGKEPYSLAGSILATDPAASSYDIKILGTDIDRQVLNTAEAGAYALEEVVCPSEDHWTRLFAQEQRDKSILEVRPALRAMCVFRTLNLFSDWPMAGQFDLILCRNVAIYFDKPTQTRLWAKFRDYLRPNGHLLIGHSERISNPQDLNLKLCDTTAYRFKP